MTPLPSEYQIHCGVADVLRANAKPEVIWFHCPNGEERDKRVAAKLKLMGVLPGVPDFIILLPSPIPTMFIPLPCFLEVKTLRGTLSKEQEDFRDRVVALGCMWSIARSVEAAVEILTRWGALRHPMRVAA